MKLYGQYQNTTPKAISVFPPEIDLQGRVNITLKPGEKTVVYLVTKQGFLNLINNYQAEVVTHPDIKDALIALVK